MSADALEAAFASCATPPTCDGALLSPADWLALAALLQREGLLTADEVEHVGERLQEYPVSMERLRMEFARQVPEATALDACFADAAARVRALGPLLAQWELQRMSRSQTRQLLSLLEELEDRLRHATGKLAAWHHAFSIELGDESTRSVFWDSLDPAAAAPYSAHAFQRDMAWDVERRRSRRRVQAVRPTKAAPRIEVSGVEHHICVSAESGARVAVLVAPHAGVPFDAMQSILQNVEAHRQLALSPHFPDVLAAEPIAPRNTCRVPSSRWVFELVEAPSLRRLRDHYGPIGEASELHRHWRRGVVEALLHLSAQCIFLLRESVSLANVRAADAGERIVLTGLEFGDEFPEAMELHGSLRLAPSDERSWYGSGSVSSVAGSACDHQSERDAYLVRDAVGIISELLPSTAEEAAAAVATLRPEGGVDLLALPQLKSMELRAICSAAAGSRAPTLQQLLSHPYFAPLSQQELLEVEPQYERWRQGEGAHRATSDAA